jgi:hypothetical protein
MDLVEPEFQKILDDVDTDLREEAKIWQDSAKVAFQAILDALGWFGTEMKKGFEEIIRWLEDRIGVSHGTIAAGWSELWNSFLNIVKPIWDFLQKAWHDFWALFESDEKTGTTNVQTGVQDHITWWQDTFGPFITWAQTIWHDFWALFESDSKTGTENSKFNFLIEITTGIVNFVADITQKWNDFWAGLTAAFDQWNADTNAKWNQFWTDLGATFTNWWTKTVGEWNQFWADLGTTLTNATGGMIQGAVNAVSGIANAMNGIKAAFADPINWVINNVINGGIVKAWNNLMGMIGGSTISGVSNVGGGFGTGMATGGMVPGSGNTDSVPAMLMPGEYVLSKPAIANMGGLGAVDQMHRSARGGALGKAKGGVIGHYAAGGPIPTPPVPPGPGGILGTIGNIVSSVVSWWSQIGPQVTAMFMALIPSSVPGAKGTIGPGINRIAPAAVEKTIAAAQAKLSALMTTLTTIDGVTTGGAKSLPAFDNGGYLQPGKTTAINGTGKPEAVLTAPQWDAVMSKGGPGGNEDILRKLDELIEAIHRTAGPPVINVNTGDTKSQNVRNDQLALRLGRR